MKVEKNTSFKTWAESELNAVHILEEVTVL